jgi:hypothetical protein
MYQLSLFDALHSLRIKVGDVVRTSYGTGPYRVAEIATGCICPEYVTSLDYPIGKAPPSPEHFHLVVVRANAPIGAERREKNCCYLGGYAETPDGRYRSVWNDDELFLELEPAS